MALRGNVHGRVVNSRKHSVTVYPASSIAFLGENDVLSGKDVVPGWSVLVKDIFA
ncbi:MAG: hypothetical protein ACREV0_11730 [Burkholderiales bacterium]